MIPGFAIKMPGRSHRGPLPPLSEREKALAEELRRDVGVLAGDIGPRNTLFPEGLRAAEDFLLAELRKAGHEPKEQAFRATFRPTQETHTGTPVKKRRVEDSGEGFLCKNFEVEIPGTSRPDEIFIAGAHYDSVMDCPGANDNGTGAAGVLALARAFAGRSFERTLRLVLFVNEEPPYFLTEFMGSRVYADACAERGDNIVGMLNLETIGYYDDGPKSQVCPPPLNLFYPTQGNYIAFVGNAASKKLIRDVTGLFRKHAQFPSEGVGAPEWTGGIGASDHSQFWTHGWPALMATDTAPMRYEHYHTLQDTPDKVDYERTARVMAGIEKVVADLANGKGA